MRKGIIVLPMILGRSAWHSFLYIFLKFRGYQVEIVDLYKGQEFKRPFFMKVIGRNEDIKLKRLASQFNDDIIHDHLNKAIQRLRQKNCDEIFLFGSSLGGFYAIEFALKNPKKISGIVVWYPILIFPEGFANHQGDPKPNPSVERLKTKLHIFLGSEDNKLHPTTLKIVKSLTIENSNISHKIYEEVGHGFLEPTVQSIFPNPFFRPGIALKSLKEALFRIEKFVQV